MRRVIEEGIDSLNMEILGLKCSLENEKREGERLFLQNRITLKREQILEKLKQITTIKQQQAEEAELEVVLERERVKERDASKIIAFSSIFLILTSHLFLFLSREKSVVEGR